MSEPNGRVWEFFRSAVFWDFHSAKGSRDSNMPKRGNWFGNCNGDGYKRDRDTFGSFNPLKCKGCRRCQKREPAE